MAEEKKEKIKKEYTLLAPVVPYDNKLDYVYGFTAVPATADNGYKGEKHSVIVPGYDLSAVLKTKAGAAFEKWAIDTFKGLGGPQGLLKAALQQLGTKPAYTKGGTPEESQATFNEYDWSGTRKKGEAAIVKAKAAEHDATLQKMAEASDAELMAIAKEMQAKAKAEAKAAAEAAANKNAG